MSMKKAIDQTIRDLKREVNKKVLKVPSIEQKVLDATSNEPWGPHGSLLADIAQASRNYHEYQMIMAVIWKRINDTGKNWRHVYKALIILEYMVAHGSERVIDDIREHAYQISTLSNFQYIDSSGRDQGNNVRRKSQSLVLLVNDKDRIQEVRQKAAANRDKFRNSSAMGGMYRPSPYSSSGGYGDDRYDGSYEERNGYGREREWGYRDDGSYGYGNSYSREGDRYGRESEERYGRDSYRDDDYHYRSRSKSSDRYGDRDHAYDADDHHSSRGSSVKADDHSQGGRPIERKFSEQNLAAPPSYEEVVGDSRSPAYSERDGETPATLAPKSSSPAATSDASPTTADQGSSSNANQQADSFDEFDPRGSVSAAPTTTAVHATSAAPTMAAVHATSAAPTTSNNAEMDLLGSLSESFSPPPLAIVPVSSGPAASEGGIAATNPEPSFMAVTSATTSVNQSFEDPFGDMPFKATSFDEVSAQPQNFNSTASFESTMNNFEQTQPVAQNLDTVSNLNCGDTFPSTASSSFPNAQTSPNSQFLPQEPPSNSDGDILAGILPPSGPSVVSQAAFSTPSPQPFGMPSFMPQSQHSSPNPYQLSVSASAVNSNIGFQIPAAPATQQNDDFLGGLLSQVGSTVPSSSRAAGSSSAGPLVLVPQQPHNEKFEPKSAVWADTLSRGLVNLNISGAKVNPLADIGIDFESLNRKEKRMEKPSTAPASSNITMGKAMGSGSGMGRASAGTFRPPSNTMMGSGMGMSMGGGPGMSMGGGPGMPMAMGSYGAVNHQMGMGMGMGMNPGMVMNPGMMPSGSNMGGYNPMMGRGGYPPQPPYGGGYR